MTANEYAISQGYRGCIEESNWRGYTVYKPIIVGEEEDKTLKVGYPLRILKKEEVFRLTTPKEALDYLNR